MDDAYEKSRKEGNVIAMEEQRSFFASMRRIAGIGVLFVSLVAIGVWYVISNGENVPRGEETSIKLFFYDPSLDQGPGGVQCTAKGLVAVERVIPRTMTPLKDAIELLLRGEISDEERAQGVESEFPLDGVRLEKAVIDEGVATLTFQDPQNKTGGGSCRVSILWHQIEATAKQFPTVQSVRFEPEELFQP